MDSWIDSPPHTRQAVRGHDCSSHMAAARSSMAAAFAATADGERDEPEQQATSTRVFYLGPVRLEVDCVETFRGKLLGGGVDATGQMLWPGSLVLCRYLLGALQRLETAPGDAGPALVGLQEHQQQQPQGEHVVELGAGATGLAGLLWARLRGPRTRVTLTDRDAPSLVLLDGNAARANREVGGAVAVAAARALGWGDEAQAGAVVAERGPATLVLGADILYPAIEVATIGALLRTARRLLGAEAGSEGRGRVLLSFIDRDHGGSLRNLMRALRAEAFVLERAWELKEGGGSEQGGEQQLLRIDEEEEEEEEEGQGQGQGQQQTGRRRRRRRRRPVIMMRGAKLLLLAPLVPGDPTNEAKQEAAEERWLPGVLEEPALGGGDGDVDSDAEWAPPFGSSDDEEGQADDLGR